MKAALKFVIVLSLVSVLVLPAAETDTVRSVIPAISQSFLMRSDASLVSFPRGILMPWDARSNPQIP